MGWLSAYRGSLTEGTSSRVVSVARWLLRILTTLWCLAMVILFADMLPNGGSFWLAIALTMVLLGACFLYGLVRLFFDPTETPD